MDRLLPFFYASLDGSLSQKGVAEVMSDWSDVDRNLQTYRYALKTAMTQVTSQRRAGVSSPSSSNSSLKSQNSSPRSNHEMTLMGDATCDDRRSNYSYSRRLDNPPPRNGWQQELLVTLFNNNPNAS